MRCPRSKMLKHVLSDFHHYVERVRKVSLSGTKRAKESNEEHKRIVEALKAHDAEKAQQLANQHIMNTIHSYDRYGWDNAIKYEQYGGRNSWKKLRWQHR